MSEKFIIFSHNTLSQECIYETANGREWLPLESVATMEPLPKPALFSKEEAQQISNKYGKTVALYPATPELLDSMSQREWYSGWLPPEDATESDEPMSQPQTRQKPVKDRSRFKNKFFKGRRSKFPHHPKHPHHPNPETEKPKGKRGFSPLMFMICFCLGVTLFLIAVWNVQPFIKFVELISTKFNFTQLIEVLQNLWGVGDFFKMVNFVIVGSTIYLICQAFELGPMLYRRNPKRVRKLLNALAFWNRVQVNAADPKNVRELKKAYNQHPITAYLWLCAARDFTYLFELVVWFTTEPPAKPHMKAIYYIATLQFWKLDWISIFLALSILFFFQIIIGGFLTLYPEIFPVEPVEAGQLNQEIKKNQGTRSNKLFGRI